MMKKKMPSEGLRLGRDSGSIICDTLKKWRFRTGWGGGKTLSIRQIVFHSHIIIISFHSFHPNRFSYFSCKSNIFLRNQQIKPRKFCRLKFIYYFCREIIKKSPVTDVNTQSWTQHIADMIF